METSTADSSVEEILKHSTPENVDVEMAVVGTMVNKPDKNIENTEMSTPNSSPKKKVKKKKHKSVSPIASHKKPKKDPNKPEYPKVGYVRFMFARREELRNEFPDMHHLDVTKKIGEEWTTMSEEKKAPYLEAAKVDKIRYKREMKEYTKNLTSPTTNGEASKGKKKKAKKNASTTESSFEESPQKSKKKQSTSITNGLSKGPKASKLSNGIQNGSKSKSKSLQSTAEANRPIAESILTPSSTLLIESMPIYGDIPIFTNQFLEHNRQMESELKKLRKLNTDYEQQNAVLEKHVENVRNGITKTNTEIADIQCETEKLTKYLDMLKQKLAHQFRNLSIPGHESNGATIDNIDKYMNDLYEMAKNDSHGPASLNKAKDLLRKVDLTIDLKTFHGI